MGLRPHSTDPFRDAVAVVTGASSGIGAATAKELARRGAIVVAVARRADRLGEVVRACERMAPRAVPHGSHLGHPADVASREACEEVVAFVLERFGRVDILVNNAGVSLHGDITSVLPQDVERVMAVNFFAPVYLTLAVLPGMVERGRGSVVNIGSVAAVVPNAGEAAYGASKAGLARWSHGLSVELHGTGVHVGMLHPGPIDTDMWDTVGEIGHPGKLYRPEVVARGVTHMIERRQVQLTVPRRFGGVGVLYPLLGGPVRWGLRRYDKAARAQAERRAARGPG
ncbi:MAG TPA: SDR family oxidoreductase [Acidimicrobiales bacterium]|nr:SDR family oxidoreductase [Acidimicrobiales bacterium]